MRLTQFLINEAREDYVAQQMGPKIMDAFKRDNGRKPQGVTHALPLVQYFSQNLGSEFIQWIMRQYVAGNFKCEDLPQLKSDLVKFRQLVKANRAQNKDINRYPTLKDLRTDIKQHSVAGEGYNGKLERLYRGLDEAVKRGLGKWLYNTPEDPIKIYIPTCEAGSVAIRKAYPDIAWCTTYEDDDIDDIKARVIDDIANDLWNKERRTFGHDEGEAAWEALLQKVEDEVENGEYDDAIAELKENMHDYYLKEFGGEFYVILTPEGPYQLHFESNQFKDQNDDDVPLNKLATKYTTIKQVLGPIINKIGHPHFLPAETIEDIKRAVMASYENIPQVKHQQLSFQDWADIILQKLKGFDSYSNPKEVQHILSTANSAMRYKGSMRDHDRGTVFEKIVQALPNKINAKHLPYDILQVIEPEIGKKYIKMYTAPSTTKSMDDYEARQKAFKAAQEATRRA